MPHPLVVHVKKDYYDVYGGRGKDPNGRSWAVPKFSLGNEYSYIPTSRASIIVASREESIERHRIDFNARIELDPAFAAFIKSLKGKRLGCWCAPLSCHCDVIAEYANRE